MNFFVIIFVVSIVGAIIGAKKHWMGGIAALLIGPFGIYFNTSFDIFEITISILFLFLVGVACGFLSSIIFSGLKGGSRNGGQTFGCGFGAHHPGGIILSDDEIKILNDKNIQRKVVFSY